MPEPAIAVRNATPADAFAIDTLVRSAFVDEPGVATLVRDLREAGDAVIELVASAHDRVIGQVLFSRIRTSFGALALAPLSVDTGNRRKGLGGQLVEGGLTQARERGWPAVFVLGDSAYYGRFGFTASNARGFASRYAGPHFMALGLNGAMPATGDALIYPPAFDRLDGVQDSEA